MRFLSASLWMIFQISVSIPAFAECSDLLTTSEDVIQTLEFAATAHGNQKYGDKSYRVHLQAVMEVLSRFGVTDRDLLKAAALHDILEDTKTSFGEIEKRFGKNISEIVWSVTLEKGKSREEALAIAYPRIRTTPGAVLVKLADRIANTEACVRGAFKHGSNRKLERYKREWPDFYSALWSHEDPQNIQEIWEYLEKITSSPIEQAIRIIDK